jgi:uncharacterized protein YndB with AHSA1/START domain
MTTRRKDTSGGAAAPAREHELVITRTYEAARHDVFCAWTACEAGNEWSAPEGFTVAACEIDPRPGGTWALTMRGADGEELHVGGTYREVRAPERLVATHAWRNPDGTSGQETLMSVNLTDRSGRTEMRFRQTGFDSVDARNGHRDGWSECFDKLERYLAARRG